MPARPRPARHAHPRARRARQVALPGTLLAVGAVALGGLAVLPAAASTTSADSSSSLAGPSRTVLTPQITAPHVPRRADLVPGRPVEVAAPPASSPMPITAPRASRARATPPAPSPVRIAASPVPTTAPRVSRERTTPPVVAVRPGDGRLTSPFGQRWGRLHAGIDLAAGIGSPVRAALPGTVQTAEVEGGYGRVVRLLHADGTVTVYGHLSELLVTPGQVVQAGDQIGREGSSGHSTGPHLHFEVRVHDAPIDPIPWLAARGITV